MYNFNIPEPLNLKIKEIQIIANAFKNKVNFQYGDRLESLLHRIGCQINSGSVKDDEISMIVYRHGNFEIFIPYLYKISTKQRLIGHLLGHYVLHSDIGSKRTIFLNWDKDNLQIEHEANRFSKAFLSFENVPDENNHYLFG